MFGSGRQKLADNATMNDANDVIHLWRKSSLTCSSDAVHIHAQFGRFWGNLTP